MQGEACRGNPEPSEEGERGGVKVEETEDAEKREEVGARRKGREAVTTVPNRSLTLESQLSL